MRKIQGLVLLLNLILCCLTNQQEPENPFRSNNDASLQQNIPKIINALRADPSQFVPIIKLLFLDHIDPATNIHKLNGNYYEDGLRGINEAISFISNPLLKNLKPFSVSISLNRAANFHSSMMSKHGELGHIDDTGRGIDIWLKPFGSFEHTFKHHINESPSSSSSSQNNKKYSAIYELVSVITEAWAYGEISRKIKKTTPSLAIKGLDSLEGLEIVLEWIIDDGGFEKRNMKLLLKQDDEPIKIGFATRRDIHGSHDIYNTLIMTKGFIGAQAGPGKQDVLLASLSKIA